MNGEKGTEEDIESACQLVRDLSSKKKQGIAILYETTEAIAEDGVMLSAAGKIIGSNISHRAIVSIVLSTCKDLGIAPVELALALIQEIEQRPR